MPRAGLTPDRVTHEAARLADEEGFAELHLGRLAERLGVRTPSLYKHVGGLPDLRRRITLLALDRFAEALGQAGDLEALGHAYRRFAREHPGLYEATVRAPTGDDDELVAAGDAALAPLLAVIDRSGLEGAADRIHAARAIRSALHGFVTLEAAGGFGRDEPVDESFARMLGDLGAALHARA